MFINNIQYSIALSDLHLEDMVTRRKIEDELREFSFGFLALPSEAPPEIPRMTGQTKNGHSHLQIANNNILLSINFDQNYHGDMEKSFNYAYEKIDAVKLAFRNLSIKPYFSGVVIRYIDNTVTDPVRFLSERIFPVKTKQKVVNLSNAFAIEFKEKYFINITLNNVQLQKSVKDEIIENGLALCVDINNRYWYNKKMGISDQQDIEEIKALHKIFIMEKWPNFFGEELNFDV